MLQELSSSLSSIKSTGYAFATETIFFAVKVAETFQENKETVSVKEEEKMFTIAWQSTTVSPILVVAVGTTCKLQLGVL